MVRKLAATLCAAALVLISPTARAIDVAPGDYAIMPPGTNVGLLYFQSSTSNELRLPGTGKVPNSKLDTSVAILRGLSYSQISGIPLLVQAVLPMGRITTARIGGVSQGVSDGIGDLTLGASLWPVSPSNPETGTTLGVTTFITAPTGRYDAADISLGKGTWTITPQVGLIQGLGAGFFIDATLDAAFTVGHNEGGARISIDPAYQAQIALRKQFTQQTSFAIGYSGQFGGDQKVNGVKTGLKTRRDQLRLYGNTFILPGLQLQAMVGRDLHVEGGFKTGIVGEIRLLKVF